MSKELVAEQPKNQVAVIFDNITNGLKAFETRKEEFTILAEEAAGFKITTYEDKTNLKQAVELRKKMKAARVKVQNEGKAMRDPLNGVNKEISAKENELVAIVSPGEKSLQEIEDWYDAEKDRIAKEEADKENARIQNRINRMSAFGYEIDFNMVKILSDDDFEKMVERAKREFEKEEADKAEKARQEQAQREQDEKDRAELKALRERQEAADKILQEREDEIARKEAQLKEKEEDDRIRTAQKLEKEMKDARFEPRKVQLLRMGFTTYGIAGYPDFSLEDTWSTQWEQVYNMEDAEWPEYIKDIEAAIQRRKVRIEEEEKRQAAALEEARLKGIEEAKREAERRATDEAERIAMASDSDKLAVVVSYLEGLPTPEMKSAKSKKTMAEVKELTGKIIVHIKSKV